MCTKISTRFIMNKIKPSRTVTGFGGFFYKKISIPSMYLLSLDVPVGQLYGYMSHRAHHLAPCSTKSPLGRGGLGGLVGGHIMFGDRGWGDFETYGSLELNH